MLVSQNHLLFAIWSVKKIYLAVSCLIMSPLDIILFYTSRVMFSCLESLSLLAEIMINFTFQF